MRVCVCVCNSYIIHKTWVLHIYRTRNAHLNVLIDS